MIEAVLMILLFVVVGGFIMVGTNILYDLASAVVPLAAILMVSVGILVGFFVAVRNTFVVYRTVYGKKGKQK